MPVQRLRQRRGCELVMAPLSNFDNIDFCDGCSNDFCVSCNSGGDCMYCGIRICEDCVDECSECDEIYCKRDCINDHKSEHEPAEPDEADV